MTRDCSALLLDVRFSLIADKAMHRSDTTRWARRRHVARNGYGGQPLFYAGRSLSSVAFRLRRRHLAEIVPAVTSRLRTVEQLPLAHEFRQHVFAKQPHTLGASEIGMVKQPEAEIMMRLRGEITEQPGVIVAHEAWQ